MLTVLFRFEKLKTRKTITGGFRIPFHLVYEMAKDGVGFGG